MTEDELETLTDKPTLASGHLISTPLSTPDNIDKINNLAQKETSLRRSGVTRYKYMLVIAEALEATKWADEPDEQGNIKRVQKPDVQRRQWAAEQAARLLGDYVEIKNVTVGHFTLMDLIKLSKDASVNKTPSMNRLP